MIPVIRTVRRTVRRAAPCSLLWRRGLDSEIAFWERFVRSRGAEWPEDYRQRFTPGALISDPLIVDCLPRIRSAQVSILDVGAGPASSLGSALPGRELELVAVDPLADEYNRLLTAHGITPPVRVLSCRGEDILDRFGSDRFDIAHARNSLDHSADPIAVLSNMLATVRSGGFVILRHWRNEGQKAEYEQLHQWNIDVAEDGLLIWNARQRHHVAELCHRAGYTQQVAVEGPIVTAVLRRANGGP